MPGESHPHRLRIHWSDIAKVRTLIDEFKQGRCVVVEDDGGEFFVSCTEAGDAADIKIAFPRSQYVRD